MNAPDQFQAEAAACRRQRKSAQDSPLVKALGLAHYWQRLLDEGRFQTLSEIAAAERVDQGQASWTIRLAQLAPDITEACLAVQDNPPALESLSRGTLPADWEIQRNMLITRGD